MFHALGFPLQKAEICRYNQIINSKGPYLGFITVCSLEENAFFSTGYFQPDSQHPFLDLSGNLLNSFGFNYILYWFKISWRICLNSVIILLNYLQGRWFRVGTLQGKEVIYDKCGVGMVKPLHLRLWIFVFLTWLYRKRIFSLIKSWIYTRKLIIHVRWTLQQQHNRCWIFSTTMGWSTLVFLVASTLPWKLEMS